jgi:hypothetical protein
MTTAIETTEVEKKAITLTERVSALVIVTNEDRMGAEYLMEDLSAAEKAIFGYLDPPRAQAYDLYLSQKKRLDDALNPVKQAKKDAKQKCISWDAVQEAKRREEQARLEAEARKRAEDEQLALAAQLEKEGDQETAEAVLAEPVQVAPVVVQRTAPAATRLSAGRSVWSAEVTNLMALVKAVAEGRQPITLLEPNMTALNGMARSLKSSLSIPGVRAVERKA